MHLTARHTCLLLLPGLLAGCATTGSTPSARERALADAARPILTLDPHAVWTDGYNRLLAAGPEAIDFLMRQPALAEPAAPDSLATMLHVSLVRMLVQPGAAPPVSATALETTLGLLHFDVKVGGDRIGTLVMTDAVPPRMWHDLYPADFNHARAGKVDVEADRRALVAWWQERVRTASTVPLARPLEPQAGDLWRVLNRQYADRWQYQPEARPVLVSASSPADSRCHTSPYQPAARPVLVSAPPPRTTLIDLQTYEYNLVRAACIWLGARGDTAVRERLVDCVGSGSPVLSYNACFALSYADDPRIREVVRRYRGP